MFDESEHVLFVQTHSAFSEGCHLHSRRTRETTDRRGVQCIGECGYDYGGNAELRDLGRNFHCHIAMRQGRLRSDGAVRQAGKVLAETLR